MRQPSEKEKKKCEPGYEEEGIAMGFEEVVEYALEFKLD